MVKLSHLQQNNFQSVCEYTMAELATVTSKAFKASVVKFAWKIRMHVQTFVLLSTAIHKIKFTQFHFARRHGIMRIWTLITLQHYKHSPDFKLTDAKSYSMRFWLNLNHCLNHNHLFHFHSE